MLEVWATLKVWSDFIIPTIIIVATILTAFGIYLIKSVPWNRKIRWLRSHGFERYLIGVPAFGNGAFYWWKKNKRAKELMSVI